MNFTSKSPIKMQLLLIGSIVCLWCENLVYSMNHSCFSRECVWSIGSIVNWLWPRVFRCSYIKSIELPSFLFFFSFLSLDTRGHGYLFYNYRRYIYSVFIDRSYSFDSLFSPPVPGSNYTIRKRSYTIQIRNVNGILRAVLTRSVIRP